NDVTDGNSGSVVGNVSFVPGEVGIGMNCTGAPAGISISNNANLNFGPAADFSIECWVNPVVAATAYDVMSLVDKRVAPNDVSSVGYELYLGSGKLAIQISDSLNKPYLLAGLAGPDMRNGLWHHVAASIQRTATNGGKLYVDGQLVSTFDPT